MEISLSQVCSGDDVVTPISYEDELMRLELGFDVALHYPQTKHKYRSDRRPARELLNEEQKAFICRNCHVEFETLGFER